MSIKNEFKKNKIIVNSYNKAKKLYYPIDLTLGRVCKKAPQEKAISENKNKDRQIIVSLTSFPGRINLVHKTLFSIMNQSYKPNMIILWLSEEQFPNKEKDLPSTLINLKKYGLSIMWVKNDIKSYKKLIPALERFRDEIIITADDDLYYPKYWIERLVSSYKKHPEDIHCHLITRIKCENKKINTVKREKIYINKPSFNNKLLGGSGTLYPPNSLHCEVTNEKLFMKLAPTSDDIWFWAMALKNGTKIRWIENSMKKLYYTENSQETDCLWKINDQGEKLFSKHIKDIANEFNLYDLLSI